MASDRWTGAACAPSPPLLSKTRSSTSTGTLARMASAIASDGRASSWRSRPPAVQVHGRVEDVVAQVGDDHPGERDLEPAEQREEEIVGERARRRDALERVPRCRSPPPAPIAMATGGGRACPGARPRLLRCAESTMTATTSTSCGPRRPSADCGLRPVRGQVGATRHAAPWPRAAISASVTPILTLVLIGSGTPETAAASIAPPPFSRRDVARRRRAPLPSSMSERRAASTCTRSRWRG